jgi:hypothetical protein
MILLWTARFHSVAQFQISHSSHMTVSMRTRGKKDHGLTRLTLHGTHPCVHEEHPARRFVVLP